MITASIVTYNTEWEQLQTVLQCAFRADVDHIFVVDNSPCDSLRKKLDNFSDKIEYIFGQGNVGYGAAHNIAIRRAMECQAKYHIVLNPDIEFKSDGIQKLAQYMEAHLNVGWVMPKVIYPDGKLQYLCKLLPTPLDLFGRRFLGFLPIIQKRDERFEMRITGYNKEMDVPFCSGCFMFLRVETLQEVGMFDDHIFMYAEDLDLSRRIHTSAHWVTRFYPEVTIIHAHNKESYRSKKMLWVHIKSIIYYFNKYGWLFDRQRRQINRKIQEQACFTSHNS